MNNQEIQLLLALLECQGRTQRELAEATGLSLGKVNNLLKSLRASGWIDGDHAPTDQARELAEKQQPRNAIILAAGYGIRMVPIHVEMPKGLLTVHGEVLVERLIRQLREKGIREIHLVVGFQKEKFEYLMDAYGVHLVVNPEYASRNNLHSLALAARFLGNSYILPCDLWCAENPFRPTELAAWYMMSRDGDPASMLRVGRGGNLLPAGQEMGNRMVGIAYLPSEEAQALRAALARCDVQPRYQDAFWEQALFGAGGPPMAARMTDPHQVHEINTYGQLLAIDADSKQLDSQVIRAIESALGVSGKDMKDMQVLKKGMTNRSFRFRVGRETYIFRVPGEGTSQMIDRKAEYAVYQTIAPLGISEDLVFFDPETGYKITRFWQGARVCDPEDEAEVAACMRALRRFHGASLQVPHTFDLFERIGFYEGLRKEHMEDSLYPDYQQTKEKVLALRAFVEAQPREWTLAHIDSVPDNFLFLPGSEGEADLRLIDWEYAGMQDPHVDIAMFAVYAMYDHSRIETLIAQYFPEGVTPPVHAKIYSYIAICGLLWSNWCEYKHSLGVEFGEYSLCQYRFAKEYARQARQEIALLIP